MVALIVLAAPFFAYELGSRAAVQSLYAVRIVGAENVNVETDWGLSVTHFQIDDALQVRDFVKARLRAHVNAK